MRVCERRESRNRTMRKMRVPQECDTRESLLVNLTLQGTVFLWFRSGAYLCVFDFLHELAVNRLHDSGTSKNVTYCPCIFISTARTS